MKCEAICALWQYGNPMSKPNLDLLTLDAPKCGSGAYRNTRIWQNLMPYDAMLKEHARLLPPSRPFDAALTTIWLSRLITFPTIGARNQPQLQHTPLRGPLPYMGTHPDTAPVRVHKGILGRCMLYVSDTPSTPSAEVREVQMGFHIGDTAPP